MLRVGMQTSRGPVALFGINFENKRRLEAGMPLVGDLKAIANPGQRFAEVIVHYAHTYSDVVDDLAKGGLPVTDQLREIAANLDAEMPAADVQLVNFQLSKEQARQILMWAEQGRLEYQHQPNEPAEAAIAEFRRQLS